MSWNTVILIIVIAAVVYFVWKQRGAKSGVAPADSAGAASGASVAGDAAASYDDYRQRAPSNMINGKLTCNRCGSNLIRTEGGTASCTSCGAALYRT